jgi:hypothetical protein
MFSLCFERRNCISLSFTLSGLQIGSPENWVSLFGMVRYYSRFLCIQTDFGAHEISYAMSNEGSSLGEEQPKTLARLRACEIVPSLNHTNAFTLTNQNSTTCPQSVICVFRMVLTVNSDSFPKQH